MTTLLDANVLVAVAVADHVHHAAAETWLAALDTEFATCPITQGALLRLVLRHGGTTAQARHVLAGFTNDPRHCFWPDDLDYGAIRFTAVVGHRQVTDAYLAGLARHRGGRLLTFDRGLAAAHPDVADLLTPGGQVGVSG